MRSGRPDTITRPYLLSGVMESMGSFNIPFIALMKVIMSLFRLVGSKKTGRNSGARLPGSAVRRGPWRINRSPSRR